MEVLIPLKNEHMPDLFARIRLLETYQAQAQECGEALHRSKYIASILEDAFQQAIERDLSKESPQELVKVAILVQEHRVEAAQHRTRHEKLLGTHEAMKEALTLWLAKLYEFDPMKDKYELDLDNRVLRKEASVKVPEQEAKTDKGS